MATAPELSRTKPSGFFTRSLADADPAVSDAIKAELRREQDQIELIASENIVSRAVLEAQGSVLTNKYAEGYPGRRYYQGCAPSDAVETLASERATGESRSLGLGDGHAHRPCRRPCRICPERRTRHLAARNRA